MPILWAVTLFMGEGMHVLVLGGYGLIGLPTVLTLLAKGHRVTGLGRAGGSARNSVPEATWIAQDIARLTNPEDWLPLLAGIDAVVNCAGALQDSVRDNLQALHCDAMKALFEACQKAGIRRIVQVSAAGVSPAAATPFFRTKAEADAALMMSEHDWVILRPGLVIAPAAYGGTALIRGLASFPFVIPVAGGHQIIQTVSVEDVADAIVASVEGQVPARASYDLVEESQHSLLELVRAFRAWLGYAPAPVVSVPAWIGRVLFKVGDACSLLGWRAPMRTTALLQLETGVQGDASAWARVRGRAPARLSATLRRHPATVQERWFGRLWLLKAPVIATLSLFWLASGMIGLIEMRAATAVLTERGMGQSLASLAVFCGSLVDITLGMAVLVRSACGMAAVGMIVTTMAYLAAGTTLAPDLWADPLGPLVKTVPGAMLAFVALVLSEER